MFDSNNILQNVQYFAGDASIKISPAKTSYPEIRLMSSDKKLLQSLQELSFIEIHQNHESFLPSATADDKNKIVHQMAKKYMNLSRVESLDELFIDCPFDAVMLLSLDNEIQAPMRQYVNDARISYRLDLYNHFSCLLGIISTSDLQHQVLVAYSNAISLQNTLPNYEGRWPKVAHLIAQTGYALGYQRVFQNEFPMSKETLLQLEKVSASRLYFLGLKLLKTPLFDENIPEEHPTIAAMLFENGYKNEKDFNSHEALSVMNRLAQVSVENNKPDWYIEWEKAIKYCKSLLS